MSGFQPDPFWNRPVISYFFAVLADAAGQEALGRAMEPVRAAAGPGLLHAVPAPSLHVTLYSVTPVRGDFDKDEYWRRHGAAACAEFSAWAEQAPAMRLHFRELRATAQAVIAVAEPLEPVWELRRRLAASLPEPPGGAAHYDIIHCTLARYAAPERLPPDFARRVAASSLKADWPLREARLLRETVYPTLAFEMLGAFPLSVLPVGAREAAT